MNSKKVVLLPKMQRILAELGENIKLARLRRKLGTEQIAERAGITRTTLWAIEKGAPQGVRSFGKTGIFSNCR